MFLPPFVIIKRAYGPQSCYNFMAYLSDIIFISNQNGQFVHLWPKY